MSLGEKRKLQYENTEDWKRQLLQTQLELHENVQSACPFSLYISKYEGWNFNSGNYLFTTDTK